MSAGEKIAYLKGLVDAGSVTDPTAAAVLQAALEAFEALAAENLALRERMEEQAAAVNELYQVCDDLDTDLSDVETRLGITDGLDSSFDEDYRETNCPSCGLHFFCHASMVSPEGTVECPDCGKSFTLKDTPVPDDDESDG